MIITSVVANKGDSFKERFLLFILSQESLDFNKYSKTKVEKMNSMLWIPPTANATAVFLGFFPFC